MPSNFSLDAYLARIGCERPVTPDLTSLRRLQAAHVRAIPFEGIDPLVGTPVSLDAASVWRKLVESRRGGYCFEQNALFKTALEAIGFKTTGLGARVRWMSPPDSPLGPREHMLIKVDLPEGPFLADVGFGACLIDAPLPLATGQEHRTEMGAFRLDANDGLYWLNTKQPGGWRVMYAFNLEPQIAADYELGNWYTATNPRAPFVSFLIVERLGADRRHKLVNTRYIVEARDGEPESVTPLASSAELGRVLGEVFGIVPPVPIERLYAKVADSAER